MIDNPKLSCYNGLSNDNGSVCMFRKSIDEFMYYLPFLREVIRKDFKKKYHKSVLGVAWSMLSPLLMMLVITVIFSTIFRRSIPYYPSYWLGSNLIFAFVMDGAQSAMNSVINNSSLIRKMKIPNYFFCISSVTQNFITMLLSLIPYFAVSFIIGVQPSPYMLMIFFPIILAYIFTIGLGLFLCAYGTFLRDFNYLFTIARRAWLYITPIFYPIDIIPENYRFMFELNPLYVYITIFRDFAMNNTMPSERLLIVATFYSILTLILGMMTFKEKEDRFFLYI